MDQHIELLENLIQLILSLKNQVKKIEEQTKQKTSEKVNFMPLDEKFNKLDSKINFIEFYLKNNDIEETLKKQNKILNDTLKKVQEIDKKINVETKKVEDWRIKYGGYIFLVFCFILISITTYLKLDQNHKNEQKKIYQNIYTKLYFYDTKDKNRALKMLDSNYFNALSDIK